MDSNTPKPSKVEGIKLASNYLRGPLDADLTSDSDHVGDAAESIIKFHGSYQQDDRDLRAQRKREGLSPLYQFMVRVRMPGGKLTADQYLACDRLAREVGNHTLRITTRQEFQFHGILKQDLKQTVRRINEILLSTLAACGDVERNVLCCPAPLADPVRHAMQADTDAFAAHFAPRTSSYWDLWLDGEKITNPLLPEPGPAFVPTPGDDPVEPIYGKAYLPRKFKTAFALPNDNCTDVYANDLGFLAIAEHGILTGYNVLVGGGMGTTPSARKTFPAVAQAMAFIPRNDVLAVGEAIIKVQRDFGNRSDRKRARLKYLIHDHGLSWFRDRVEQYLGRPLQDPLPLAVREVEDHLGWCPQGDGKWWLGLPVENGRIKDEGGLRLASGLRAFFETYRTPARLTCTQSILLMDLEPAWKTEIDAWAAQFGIPTVERTSTVRRWSMACPALPTCGLAVTESERALPGLMDRFEAMIDRLGLSQQRFAVHMTGCPNGCARPYNCDIGLVGRSASKNPDGTPGPGTYTIFLGGSIRGERLNRLYKDYVPFDQIVAELESVFTRFKQERLAGESFGDFCHRALDLGPDAGEVARSEQAAS
jgi:sulfite reductase (ferredoxin)